MSETDDTEELLIIPPNLFLTYPDLGSTNQDSLPYFNVVDSLITQVNDLENRLNRMQSLTDVRLVSNMDEILYHPNLSKSRKYNCSEDLLTSQTSINRGYKVDSTQSTPQKPRSKFTANSLPVTPSVERSKTGSPKRTLMNRGCSERRTQSEFNPMLGEIDSFLSNVKQIKRLNVARKLETDFGHLETDRDIYVQGIDSLEIDKFLRDMDLRQNNFDGRFEEKERDVLVLEKSHMKDRLWQASDKADAAPEDGYGMRQKMYPEHFSEKNTLEPVEKLPTEEVSNGEQDTDIISDSSEVTTNKKCYLKYHDQENSDVCCNAEKVSTLHKQLLDHSDVDFTLGLFSLSSLWNAKDDLQGIPSKVQQKLQEEMLRRQHCEETIKALQNKILEHQERLAVAIQVDQAKTETISKFQHVWEKLGERIEELERAKGKLELEVDELKRKNTEDAAQSKNVLAEARQEVGQSKRAVETCQRDLQLLRDDCIHLQDKLKEARDQNSRLNEEKNKLLDEANVNRSLRKTLQEELNKAREQLENNKLELRNYYQGQVEIVVQNKLKEFQNQLDVAEQALRDELSKKELSMAKMAASHIHQISEKHILEVQLLEEKHQEQCRLYQLQLSQLQQELDDTISKFKRQQDKQTNIERQLHKFMEGLKQDHVNTLDEMNNSIGGSLRSFINLEEILSWRQQGQENNRLLRMRDNTKGVAEPVMDGHPQATHKVFTIERPVSSDENKGNRGKEATLQDTIQMLIDKNKQTDHSPIADNPQQSLLYQRLLKEARSTPSWK